ncbi:UNVERIFIED_CONTAM: hypothetical protein FKN15_071811 [Acipenser sinensis]
MVDTGSTIILVRPGLHPHHCGGDPATWRPTQVQIRTVTRQLTPIHGQRTLRVQLLGRTVQHKFCLVDIHDCCIVRLDLLSKVGAMLDLGRNIMTTDDECVSLQDGSRGEESKACQGTTADGPLSWLKGKSRRSRVGTRMPSPEAGDSGDAWGRKPWDTARALASQTPGPTAPPSNNHHCQSKAGTVAADADQGLVSAKPSTNGAAEQAVVKASHGRSRSSFRSS